jgi:hypothetical protein
VCIIDADSLTDNIDFGIVGLDLSEEQSATKRAVPADEFRLPILAHAIGVGYNVRTLLC